LTIVIERPIEPDRPRWDELWCAYLAFYQTVLPPEQYDHTWLRLREGRLGGLLARDASGRAVGLTHYLFHDHAWSLVPTCYLQDLFVDPVARGGGYGRALIEAVADAARERGADRLYWLTQETNDTARRLYDRWRATPASLSIAILSSHAHTIGPAQ
jgi:GNAT superfamily N-acetyltransferase